jgi:hypothetical protein
MQHIGLHQRLRFESGAVGEFVFLLPAIAGVENFIEDNNKTSDLSLFGETDNCLL